MINNDLTFNKMDRAANATYGSIPQHNTFQFIEDGVTIDSNFDSGNLSKAERISAGIYHLWTGPDCMGTQTENGCRS